MDDPIKQLGEFKIPVRLHKDVTAEVTLLVVKED
jgi:ribosomal protein L9